MKLAQNQKQEPPLPIIQQDANQLVSKPLSPTKSEVPVEKNKKPVPSQTRKRSAQSSTISNKNIAAKKPNPVQAKPRWREQSKSNKILGRSRNYYEALQVTILHTVKIHEIQVEERDKPNKTEEEVATCKNGVLWAARPYKSQMSRKREEAGRQQQDIFAATEANYGRTNVVRHRVDIGDHWPIRQQPRRLPLALNEKKLIPCPVKHARSDGHCYDEQHTPKYT
ncbi:hypothetical protein CBL_14630 [Carabus blaptoides fortunei]